MTNKKKPGTTAADIAAASSPKVQELKAQLKTLNQRHRRLAIEAGSISNFFDEVSDAVTSLPPASKIFRPQKKDTAKTPATACLHLTDWHIGQVTKRSETDGLGAYSPEIAEGRLDKLGEWLVDWISAKKLTYKVEELQVFCTGDMVHGALHEDDLAANAFPPPVQCAWAARLLAELIGGLAEHLPVKVDFVTVDNHSRLSKKIQHAGAGLNTFGYTVGHTAELMLRNFTEGEAPRVTFAIHPQVSALVKVQGFGFKIAHGNHQRGGNTMGIPYYGLSRSVAHAARVAMTHEDKAFNVLMTGHFHAPARTGSISKSGNADWWVGPALSGTSTYDHSFGRHSPGAQCAWMMTQQGDQDYNVVTLQ